MTSGTRRELAELATLHELEPGLHEILVEGRSDARIVEMALEAMGLDAAVFAVGDRVELSNNIVAADGFDTGARGRIIAAARILLKLHRGNDLTFIADADFEYLRPEIEVPSNLLFTDYSSMDLYGFNSRVLAKFLKVGLRAPGEVDADQILGAISEGLQRIFLCRWKLRNCDPSPKMVERIGTRCKIQNNVVVVDTGKLLLDSVNSCREPGARSISAGKMAQEIEQLLGKLASDRRKYIRGHDYAYILAFYLVKSFAELFKEDRAPFKKASAVEISLRLCLEPLDLIKERMFVTLRQRILASAN